MKTLKEFFDAQGEKIGLLLNDKIAYACKIAPGDKIVNGIFMGTADQEGWQVTFNGNEVFLTENELREDFVEVKIKGIEDLPQGTQFEPVIKGTKIMVFPWSDTALGVSTTAPANGFLVTYPERPGPVFMSDIKFRSTFNNVAANSDRDSSQIAIKYDYGEKGNAIRYIVLDKDVTIMTPSGEATLEAGFAIYENKKDVDGFTWGDAKNIGDQFTIKKAAMSSKPKKKSPKI